MGIYAYGGGGYVTANTISGYNVGIYSRAYSTVSGYSNIDPHDPFTPYPNNNIQYNTYGIATYDHSTAVFGHHNYAFETEDGAYNWIENNSGSDILVGSNTTLYAENNWVGEDYEPSVIQGSGTTLSWYPPLYSNPWDEYHAAESIALSAYQSRSNAGVLFSTQQTATSIEDTGDEVALLNEAISDHIRKSYAYAKEKYAQLLSSPKYSKTALVLPSHLYRESKDENVFTLFEEQKSNVKKEPVATINLSLTSNLLANMYAERKNYTAAISTFDEVISRYPNTMEDRNARVRKIYYTLAGLHDKGSAEQQLKELLTLYKEEDDDIAMIKNFVEHASSEAFSKNKPKLQIDSPDSVSTFSLLPNCPNPFNPVTNLSFSLQASGLATLKIYDVLGREVATLVNEYLEAGDNHHRTFDASRLPSGVYYYALKSGGKQEVKKMLYLK